MCRWTAEEGASYLRWLAVVAAQRAHQPWKLDLGWLVDQDINTPEFLAAYCRSSD